MPILIVDDDQSFLSVVTAFLSNTGWNIAVATTGLGALRALHRTQFALVLLDKGLPDLDGLDVLRHIQGQLDPPPVVLISGVGTVTGAFQAAQLGATGFLEKPIAMSALEGAIFSYARPPTDQANNPTWLNSIAVAEVVNLTLKVVQAEHDVPRVADWARLAHVAPKTLAARCSRIGCSAKRVLDLVRLLRVIDRKPAPGTARLMFDNLDNRSLEALTRRVGISIESLEFIGTDDLLNGQITLFPKPLVNGIKGALRQFRPQFADRTANRHQTVL